jgi:hypothetical protein
MSDSFVFELRNRLEPLDSALEEYLDGSQLRHFWVFDTVSDRNRSAWTNHIFRSKRKRWHEAQKQRDWYNFVTVYERPHRLEGFYYIMGECTHEEYWDTLGFVWMDSENIWQNIETWQELWNCERPSKSSSMNEREHEVLASLPHELSIYRGFTEGRVEGMSWTLDRDVAVRIAQRFGGTAAVAVARARKDDIHAFFDERQEREVVIEKYVQVNQFDLPARKE